jgi:hypothetical protein
MSLYDPQPPIEGINDPAGTALDQENPWLLLSRDAYYSSTDWFDTNIRRQMERNIDNFHSRHPSGSKYHTAAYNNRSRLFRPKTRTGERKFGAAAAKAFFGNTEVVDIKPENEIDPASIDSANLNREILQYRLTNSIPWYLTVVGAAQDAYVTGIVISRQYWWYETQMTLRGLYLDQDGRQIPEYEQQPTKDQPDVRLIPIEYFRFDPGSNWRDVVTSSPYVIELMPMHLMDVRRNMRRPDEDPREVEGRWHYLTDGELLSAERNENDPTTRVRDGRRTDPRGDHSRRTTGDDFEIVWVHRNIIRNPDDGVDYLWYTAGTQHMLTDPVPVNQQYPHLSPGERDYVVGFSVVESHKIYPSGKVQLTEGLQSAANNLQNQRFDNVQLALNKRYRIRRGSSVDLSALRSSVPGGVYEVDDVNADVVEEQISDVTSSSYNEQDRLNADFDTLAGQFNMGSVATNRQLGETVGGMAMMRGDSDGMTEFDVTTFGLTWMTPALKQVMKLCQYYETDETVLMIASQKAEVMVYPGEQITDELLKKNLVLNVRVGTGATDPLSRVNNLRVGLETLAAFPTLMAKIDDDEVAMEVFNAVGYSNGERFMKDEQEQEGPSYEELMAQIEEMSPYYEEAQAKLQVEQQKGETAMTLEQMMQEGAQQIQAMRSETELTKAQINAGVAAEKDEREREKIGLSKDEIINKMLADLRGSQQQGLGERTGNANR